MAKKWAKAFYNSKGWIQCRDSYIAKVHGLCEECLKHGKIEPGYILDHIIELTPENINNPEISLNHDNLQYLSLSCHNKKTFGKGEETTVEGLVFNEHGELVRSEIDG